MVLLYIFIYIYIYIDPTDKWKSDEVKLDIIIKRCNLKGEVLEQDKEVIPNINSKQLSIWSLSVVNVPTQTDKGTEAEPLKGYLELFYIESMFRSHIKDYYRKKQHHSIAQKYEKIMYHVNGLYSNHQILECQISLVSSRYTQETVPSKAELSPNNKNMNGSAENLHKEGMKTKSYHDPRKEIPIRIDSVDYYGYKSLRISKTNISLPIMTFLPLDI